MRAKLVNEGIKHLSPRTPEEEAELVKKGFTKNGGKWKFTINIAPLMKAYNGDDDEDDDEGGDTEEFRMGMIDILTSKIEYLQDFMEDYEVDKFQEIIDEFNMLDSYPEPDEVDYVMNMLYDWADDNNVWIDSFGF